jgi:predicted LPLAT superfamily acyltransferase
MIPTSSDMSHLFAIDRALSSGEIVSIAADRVFGSPRTVTVSLLGHTATLPQGPFAVPAMRGLSVIAVNVMKTSLHGYTAYVTPLDYDRQALRKQQIRQLADAYAAELDKQLHHYPTQWYNYFDFWQEDRQ